jgi:hypothetical protein
MQNEPEETIESIQKQLVGRHKSAPVLGARFMVSVDCRHSQLKTLLIASTTGMKAA